MPSVPVIGDTLVYRYYIEEILDAEGETAVLKCFDSRLDVPQVIKILIGDHLAPDWNARCKRFVEAFRSQARLTHPNIVRVANIETRDEWVFSVMEELQGMTLEQYADIHQLMPKDVIALFIGIMDALSLAHHHEILHMGLSPRNVILNEQGNRFSPRIINFGVIRQSEKLNPISHLPYLAPEQLLEYENAMEASDVYAICASMYYVFAGEPPVVFETHAEYVDFFCSVPGITEFPESIPEEFVPLLKKGLRANPTERYANAAELLEAFKALTQNTDLTGSLSIELTKSQTHLTSVSPSSPVQIKSPSEVSASLSASPASNSQSIVAEEAMHDEPVRHQASSSISQPRRQAVSSISQPAIQLAESQQRNISMLYENIQLPASLKAFYELQRVDSDLPHAFIGTVSSCTDANQRYSIKCFFPRNIIEAAVFNECVRRTTQLQQESIYFQQIVQIHPEECAYLMPDVERQSVPMCIQSNGNFDPIVTTQIGILLAQAMDCAHQRGYVNGNLKPSNIIFEDKDGVMTPVIYDFGQRLYMDSARGLTIFDIPCIAPELNYNLQNTNPQADIFAFGMCLIYMLLGVFPYQSLSPDALIEEIFTIGTVPNILSWRQDIPDDLVQVIQWCTAFSPSERYLRFSDVLRDLYVVFQKLQSQE